MTSRTFFLICGKLLGIFGLIFVFYTLYKEFDFNNYYSRFYAFRYGIFISIILNIGSYMLGVNVWKELINKASTIRVSYLNAFKYYAKTDIAKYLPGNIFHILRRQILSNKFALTQKEMFSITMFYSYVLLVSVFLLMTIISFFISQSNMLLVILLSIISIILLSSLVFPFAKISLINKYKLVMFFLLALTLQCFIFVLIINYQISTINLDTLLTLCEIFILSWLLGFVTPGASGGLGVREGAFIFLASNFKLDISNEIVIFSILLVRLINILTDLAAYFFTYIIKGPK